MVMERTKRSTFTVLFFVKRTKLLKNGEAPVGMRITMNRQFIEVMTRRSVPLQNWDQGRERSRASSIAAHDLNDYIESSKVRLWQLHQQMEIEGAIINPKTLYEKFCGKDMARRTLLEVYQEHNDKCRALVGMDYTIATVEKFETSIKCLKQYIQMKYERDDIELREVDGAFVRDFEFHLKTVRKCQHNSALKHLKNLKKVIRIALDNEWMKRDPFVGIKFRHAATNPTFLTQEELATIINKEFTIERLSMVRDMFVFGAMTGLAFIDMQQLRTEHIIRDNGGALWIRKPRQKSGTMCNIPLLSTAVSIIEKYANHPDCIERGVVMPLFSNQKMNAYLKEIADICGINKRLTTHTARHTAASVTFLANGMAIENVSKILGHSSIKMTQHYAKVMDSSIMRDMANVERSMVKLAETI